MFTGAPDTTVRVWGVEQGQCASVIRAHTGAITGLSVHATGDYLLSSSADGTWAFSDLRRGQVLARASALDKAGATQCESVMDCLAPVSKGGNQHRYVNSCLLF